MTLRQYATKRFPRHTAYGDINRQGTTKRGYVVEHLLWRALVKGQTEATVYVRRPGRPAEYLDLDLSDAAAVLAELCSHEHPITRQRWLGVARDIERAAT